MVDGSQVQVAGTSVMMSSDTIKRINQGISAFTRRPKEISPSPKMPGRASRQAFPRTGTLPAGRSVSPA